MSLTTLSHGCSATSNSSLMALLQTLVRLRCLNDTPLEGATDHMRLPIIDTETIPLAKLHPVTKKCEPIRTVTGSIRVPESIEGCSAPRPPVALEDRVIEMDEWLNLVMLQSPRIQQNDHIDPYLCRYRPPDESSSEIRRLCLRHPLSSRPWFSLSCQAFQTGVVDRIDGYTVLALSGRVDGEQDNLAGSRESSLESRHPNDYTDDQILAIACEYARPEFLTFPRHPVPPTGPPIPTPSTIRPPIPTPSTTLPTALPARLAPSRRARKQAVRQRRSNESLNNTAVASSSSTSPAPAPSPFRFQEPITPAKAYAKHKAHGMRTTAEYLQIQPAGRKDYRGRETVTTAEKME
ncbi:MAG: hypothetical protein Q9176_002100 [Flavoplaca citrina]